MKIKKLPPSNKYKKKQTIKVKSGKNTDFVGIKNRMEERLFKSRDVFTPSDFNEMGRVWTF